jgi:hypothetical protein
MRRTHRIGLAVGIVGMVVLLGGCWPAPGAGPDRSAYNAIERGFDAGSVAGFTELWTATTDETEPRGVSHPIVSDGAVFVSSTHSVHAFDEATGATRWVKTPDPAVYDHVDAELFFDAGNVYTSLRRGEHNWEPAQFDAGTGSWFTGELNGRMEGVRTDSSGRPIVLLSQFAPTPTGGTAQSGFVFSQSGPTFLSENPTTARLVLGTDRYFHAGTGPGGDPPYDGVQAVATTGNPTGPLWRSPIEAVDPATPVLSSDGRTLFVDNGSGIAALDTATGGRRWTASTFVSPTGSPALAGDVLYVPVGAGLLALSARDGSILWSAPLGSGFGEVTLQPAVAGGVVFVATTNGTVAAFPADGGGCHGPTGCGAPMLWSASTGSPITGAPAVSLGKLVVGTQDGRVVAYGLPPE